MSFSDNVPARPIKYHEKYKFPYDKKTLNSPKLLLDPSQYKKITGENISILE
jgi:hypothetical protein